MAITAVAASKAVAVRPTLGERHEAVSMAITAVAASKGRIVADDLVELDRVSMAITAVAASKRQPGVHHIAAHPWNGSDTQGGR